MNTADLGGKFSVRGTTWGPTSLTIKDNDKGHIFHPRYDYIKWSSNVKIFQKSSGWRKKEVFYIEQNLDFLNLYEVTDVESRKSIGTIRYHFGNWEIVDDNDNYFIISKDSPLRDIFTMGNIPYYIADAQSRLFGEIQKTSQSVIPVSFAYEIDFSFDKEEKLNKALGLAVFTLFVLKNEHIFSLEQTKRLLYGKIKRFLKPKRKEVKNA